MTHKIHFQIGNCKNLIPQIVNLALQVYREDDVSSITKYYSIYNMCPESFIVATDPRSNKVLGYIISIPFSQNYFEKTITPNYDEEDLNPYDIRPYQIGNNSVYLFSIVTKPDFQNRIAVLSGLSRVYRDQLKKFSANGIYVTEASALALSESGIKICLGLKMMSIGLNPRGTVFYNPQFYKLFVDSESKDEIIKNFVRNRKYIRTEDNRHNDRMKSLIPKSSRETDYDSFWVANILGQEFINSTEFKDWINGFESRYTRETLVRMEYIWNQRKQKI